MSSSNLFTVVATDVQSFIAKLKAGLKWFGTEAAAAIAWVDKAIPGAQQALATLFQAADTAATALETHAAAGFGDVVSSAIDNAGTTVANLISQTGLDLTTKSVLTAADVATVTAAQSIASNAVSVATAKLLGVTAQAAAAANQANAPSTAAPAVAQPSAAPASAS